MMAFFWWQAGCICLLVAGWHGVLRTDGVIDDRWLRGRWWLIGGIALFVVSGIWSFAAKG